MRTARPSRPGTAQDHATEWITHSIIAGEYGPGDHIPQEDIAQKIGISLIPVRESLRRLEGLGQLTYQQQLGYFVTELTEEHLIPMFDIRKLLEEYAVKTAFPLITEEDIDQASHHATICVAALADNDLVALSRSHWSFFSAILCAEKQPLAIRLLRQLWNSTNAYNVAFYSSDDGTEKARAAILKAFRKKDLQAALEGFEEHRQRTKKVLIGIARVRSSHSE